MKKIKILILIVPAALLAGCLSTTPNPLSTAEKPLPPIYVASTNLPAYQATAQTTASGLAPVIALTPAAPLAPFVPNAVDGIFALITAASAGLAAWKNKQANASAADADSHKASAAALAATVVAAGPAVVATANTYAAQNGSSLATAQRLADASNPVQL